MLTTLKIETRSQIEFLDITARVQEVVANSGVRNGLCYLFVPHTTAGIMVNEHADPAVVEDIAARLNAVAPLQNNYLHTEGNSPAHVKAAFIGASQVFFIEDGWLVLGTWQGIFFGEFDGPRNRSLLVKITADKN